MSIENIRELTFIAGVPFTSEGKQYEIPDGRYYAVPTETMELLIEAREDNPNILEFKVLDKLKTYFPVKIALGNMDYYFSGRMVLVDGKVLNVRYHTLEMDLEQAEEDDKK